MKLLIPLLIVMACSTAHACLECHGIPDFGANPTSTASGDGELSTVSTTGPDAVVYVPAGVTVTITQPTEVYTLAVAGTLITSAELWCVNLLTYEGSEWQGSDGTEIVIRDVAPTDPSEWGTGVICAGKVYLSGSPRVPYLRAVGDLTAGQTVIDVVDPADWQVGDEVVVPDVRQSKWLDPHQHERFVIAAVDETSITLDDPLGLARLRPRHTDGTALASITLINLTRGIVIRSENPDGTRGHFACIHRADVRLTGVECDHLGRTQYQLNSKQDQQSKTPVNQIGRYGGPHLHHVLGPVSSHNGYQWEVTGCSVHDVNPMGWGFTVHQTHFGMCANNAFWSPGASSGFVTEDGPEWNNQFVGNISGGAFANYWMVGVRNTYLDNVSLNARYGWEFGEEAGANPLWPYPLNPGDDTSLYATVREKDQPPQLFSGQEVLASEVAYQAWETGREIVSETQAPDFILADSLSWNVMQGVNGYYMNNLRLEGCTFHSDPSQFGGPGHKDSNYGFAWSGRECVTMEVEACLVTGTTSGMHYRPRGSGARCRVVNTEFHARYGLDLRGIVQEPPFGDVVTEFRGCRFFPRDSQFPLEPLLMGNVGNLILVPHRIEVYDYQGVAGDDFRPYWSDQRPEFVLPDSNGVPPESVGLTNQQAWDQHGLAVCGAVAPAMTRAEVVNGFVGPLDGSDPPSPPDPRLVEVLLHDGLTTADVVIDIQSVDPVNNPIEVQIQEVP